MTIKLFCFGESGNAYKAALSLQLAGFDWEPVHVDFFSGETRTPEFRALNPMGEVPVMVDGDLVLTQSGAIQDYVVEKSGKLGWANAAERREILRWILYDNHKNSGIAGAARFNLNFLPEAKRNDDVNAYLVARHKSAMKVLNDCLEGRDWLVGGRATIADIANCGYLYYPEPFGFDRTAFPNIDAWLTRITALPGWKHPYDLMPGSPADRA